MHGGGGRGFAASTNGPVARSSQPFVPASPTGPAPSTSPVGPNRSPVLSPAAYKPIGASSSPRCSLPSLSDIHHGGEGAAVAVSALSTPAFGHAARPTRPSREDSAS